MNNASGIVVFFALMVTVGLVLLLFALNQYQQTRQLMERIANRFRGRLEPGDFLSSPQVRLKFQGYPALLKYVSVGKNRWQTVFTITWPDPDLRWNDERGHYDFGEIDFTELFEIIKGNGPCNKQRMAHRVAAHEDGAWVREASIAYAAKQAAKEAAA